jgi:hypothetical protein
VLGAPERARAHRPPGIAPAVASARAHCAPEEAGSAAHMPPAPSFGFSRKCRKKAQNS